MGAWRVTVFLLACAFGAHADEGAAPEPKSAEEARAQADGWLQALASDQFAVRESARSRILKWASSIRDRLEARREDPDPEVRRTVREALDRLGYGGPDGDPAVAPASPAALDVSRLGRVTIENRGGASTVLRVLGRPVGARFAFPPGTENLPIDVHIHDLPFFQAVDVLADAVGLHAPRPFHASDLLDLAPRRESGARLVASAVGPLRLRWLRSVPVKSRESKAPTVAALSFSLEWSPGVDVVGWGAARVVSASGPDGTNLPISSASADPALPQFAPVQWPERSVQAVAIVRAGAVPLPESLTNVQLTVPVRIRYGRRWVRFDTLNRLPMTKIGPPTPGSTSEPATVALRSFARPDGAAGAWKAEAFASLPTEAGRASLRLYAAETIGEWSVMETVSTTLASDDSLQLSARYEGRPDRAPISVRAAWYDEEGEGEVTFGFPEVPLR